MGAFLELILTVFSVFALFFLSWWLVGRLLRPLPTPGVRAVVPGRGDGEGLEQTVRSFQWLRGLGLLRCPVVIADVNLTPAGRELALRLARCWPDVVVWSAADLPDCISRAWLCRKDYNQPE